MAIFTVVEVQQMSGIRVFTYEVDAPSQGDAIAGVRAWANDGLPNCRVGITLVDENDGDLEAGDWQGFGSTEDDAIEDADF